MDRVIGFGFSLWVVAAAVFAFMERSDPPMPPTAVRVEHLLMLDALHVGERLVAVGERGRIFVSEDAGHAWRAAVSPTEAMLTALARADADGRTLVAVGHDSVILRSVDGGLTWRQHYADADAEAPLLAVLFDERGRGFAVGAYGRFLVSDDGGQTWEVRALEVTDPDGADAAGLDGLGYDFHLNAIVEVSGRLFIAGEAGTLLRSDDGGEQWMTLDAPYEGSYFGAVVTADESVLIFGMRGHVFRSDDAGETWHELDSGTETSIFGGALLADGRVVLVGQNGLVLIAGRDGAALHALDVDSSRGFVAVRGGAARDEVLLFGDEGVLAARIPPGFGSGS